MLFSRLGQALWLAKVHRWGSTGHYCKHLLTIASLQQDEERGPLADITVLRMQNVRWAEWFFSNSFKIRKWHTESYKLLIRNHSSSIHSQSPQPQHFPRKSHHFFTFFPRVPSKALVQHLLDLGFMTSSRDAIAPAIARRIVFRCFSLQLVGPKGERNG